MRPNIPRRPPNRSVGKTSERRSPLHSRTSWSMSASCPQRRSIPRISRHGRPDDEVRPDATGRERPQHPHLDRAQVPTARQYERRGHQRPPRDELAPRRPTDTGAADVVRPRPSRVPSSPMSTTPTAAFCIRSGAASTTRPAPSAACATAIGEVGGNIAALERLRGQGPVPRRGRRRELPRRGPRRSRSSTRERVRGRGRARAA